MPLDLWIYGPGYGETIVMVWDEPDGKGQKKAAVVDSYAGGRLDEHPALLRLVQHGKPELAFVAATHPHLDHLFNLHMVLRRCQQKVRNIFWWGGDDDTLTAENYALLAEDARLKGKEPGSAALMAQLFIEKARFLAGHGSSRTRNASFQALMGHAPPCQPLGAVNVWPIGPWKSQKDAYGRAFRKQFIHTRHGTQVDPQAVKSNRTSLGMVVEYGSAHIVLGGDMESPNWNQWKLWKKQRKDVNPAHLATPSVIKVSHHGSSTGLVPGMWSNGAGFFESHAGRDIHNLPEEQRPLCIVTPWRRAHSSTRMLPEDAVIRKIRESGCRLIVTGSPPGRHGQEILNRYCDSFVHVRVEANGTAHLIESRLCSDPL